MRGVFVWCRLFGVFAVIFHFAADQHLAAATRFFLSPEIEQAWLQTNRLNTSTARKLLKQDAARYPGNPFQFLIADQAAMIEILVSDDQVQYRRELASRRVRLDALEAGDLNSPYYLYALAEYHLHWAILRMKFNDQLQGALELRKSVQCIEKNQQRFPSFKLNLKTLGIIQTMAGAVPPNFQWLAEKAGIRGRAEDGLNSLHHLEQWLNQTPAMHFLLPEILFYQIFIRRNLPFETLPADLEKSALLMAAKEPLVRFALAGFAQKTSNPSVVLSLLADPEAAPYELKFCYLDYLYGEALLNSLNGGSAKKFESFISCTKGNQYVKSAYRKWAWSALLAGNKIEYQRIMKLVCTKGTDEHEDDRQAMAEAVSGSIPPSALIRARVLFDGGLYQKSANELLSIYDLKSLNHRTKAEVQYRLGRAYDKLKSTHLATVFYAAAMVCSEKIPDYFYAAAAFHLAHVYLNSGKKAEAIELFNRVLSSGDHPYKRSLDAKARAALLNMR
jgi:hypothetical protein